jgi:hypothetical protein
VEGDARAAHTPAHDDHASAARERRTHVPMMLT